MSSIKVLLVDDVRLFIEFERPFFERAGCEILSATTGEEALRLVEEHQPHIVLLDFEMPGMMGDEVCRRIKETEQTRHIPVLMVTAHRTPEIRERCHEAGCTDLISKPVSGKDLLDKVVKILEIPYRVHLRTRVHIEVSLGMADDQMSVIGYSENISEGGILVETLEPLEVGTKVRLSFAIPGQEKPFETAAEVVRIAQGSEKDRFAIGLRYDAPASDVVEKLKSFVTQEVGR